MPDSRVARLNWTGEGLRFTGGRDEPGMPTVVIDGNGKTSPGPMVTLLLACASCSSVDVVEILEKKRVKLRKLSVQVTGIRRDEMPRRYVSVNFRFELAGDGLERHHAEQAVTLSMEKYCSAIASLAADIKLTHEIEIE
jgi:putative redox protein